MGTDHEKPAAGLGSEAQDYVFDAQGHLIAQQTSNAAYTTGITRTDYTRYDGAGNLLAYRLSVYGAGNYTNDYTLTLGRDEGYHVAVTDATSSKLLPGTTTQTYDANAHLISITDSTQSANNRTFINDAAGVVLQVKQAGNTERQFVVRGEVLARTGVSVDPKQPVVKGSTTGQPQFAAVGPAGINGAAGVIATTSNPNGLDLRVSGYASIASNTATQPGSYTVRAGETLQSIAQGVYGDASLWYRIADANGMVSSNSLRAGQVLSLPAQIGGLHNNAGTVTPYDPGKVVGDTSPNLPQPQAQGGGGCGGLAMILVIVVAVVATIVTAGAAAMAMAEVGTFTAGTSAFAAGTAVLGGTAGVGLGTAVAAGAIGAAVGSIASQLTGMALGVQKDFSWKQVGMSAIGGGVSAGIAGYANQAAQAGTLLKTSAIARAALSNAISQGVNIAVGNQHSFQWKGVAASAAGAWAGQAVSDGLLGEVQVNSAGEVMRDAAGHIVRSTSDLTKGFADMFGGASGFAAASLSGIAAGTVASVARAGRVSVQQVASDAFGNALGESLAGQMSSSPSTSTAPADGVMQSDAKTRIASSVQPRSAESNDLYQTMIDNMGAGTRIDSKKGEQVAGIDGFNMGKGEAMSLPSSLASGPLLQRDEDTGRMGYDQGNGVWTFPVAENRGAELQPMDSSSSGSIRNLSEAEGFFEFTTAGRTLRGFGTGLKNMGLGTLELGKQTVLTASDLVGTTLFGATNLLSGGQVDYPLDSSLGRSVRDNGIVNTALVFTGDVMRAAVSPITSPIGSLYQQDPEGFGESMPGLLTMVAPMLRGSASSEVGFAQRVSTKPEWLVRMDEGNAFNAERTSAYPYNEVYVDKPSGTGYYRLDSYNPNAGEIVSRKFTQLADIQEQTALKYLDEVIAKYPVGATVADVPTNVANRLAGQTLKGRYILEVPVQVRTVPQSIIDAADRVGVLIRDINGKVH